MRRKLLLIAVVMFFFQCPRPGPHHPVWAATNGPDPVPSIQQYTTDDVLYVALRLIRPQYDESGPSLVLCHDPRAVSLNLQGASEDAWRIAEVILQTNGDRTVYEALQGPILEGLAFYKGTRLKGTQLTQVFAATVLSNPSTKLLAGNPGLQNYLAGVLNASGVRQNSLGGGTEGTDCNGNPAPFTTCEKWFEWTDPDGTYNATCKPPAEHCDHIRPPVQPRQLNPIIAW